MPINTDIRNELLRAVVGVARHKEFYGHVVAQFEKRYVRDPHLVKTAAVGRSKGERFVKFYLNENYFERIYAQGFAEAGQTENEQRIALKQSRDYASGAIEHEVLHVVLDHLIRNFEDHTRGNVAMDCCVNQYLSEARRHPNWIMPSRYGLPNGNTCVWYYEQLKDNKQYLSDCASGAFGVGGLMSWVNSGHSMWGDIKNDPMAREFMKDVIRKAVENTSTAGWGNVPGGIQLSIEEMLKWSKPKIPWSKVFRGFCASAVENLLSYTMSRESRRFGTRPGTRKQDVLKVAVIIDTSASISNEELVVFFNEVRWMWRNGSQVTVYEADTEVVRSYEFTGRFDGKVHGRGGTNLEPALIAVERHYDVAVYFTDFEAPKISRKYRLPVLWVLSDPPQDERHWPCHWGRTVRIDTAA